MGLRIYHNPRCTKSRQTLDLLKSAGTEPEIVEYLKTPPSEAEIRDLANKLGLAPRQMMRTQEAPYKDLALKQADDDALFAAMAAHPILIERPIVVNGSKAAIGRPPEAVNAIL